MWSKEWSKAFSIFTCNVSNEITLAGLAEYFKDDTNCISKGELKYNDNYVLEVSGHEHVCCCESVDK